MIAAVFVVGTYRSADASSPGGEGMVAFGRDGAIWVLDVESGEEQLLYAPQCATACDATGFAWSHDGSQLAFVFGVDVPVDDYTVREISIRVLDLESGATREVTDDAFSPSWSPDSSQLAWIDGPTGQVMISDAENPNPTPVFDAAEGCTSPIQYCKYYPREVRWNPIDPNLLMIRTAGGSACCTTHSLLVLDLGAGTTRSLVEWFTSPASLWFDWDPSGTLVALAFSPSINSSLRIIDAADGSSAGLDAIIYSSYIRDLSWSPSGSSIAIVCYPTPVTTPTCPEEGLYTVSPVEGSVPELLAALDLDGGLAWQPLHAEPVGLVDPGTGLWRIRSSQGGVVTFYYGVPGDYPFVGDWDCDGIDTPGLYRQSDGFAYLRNTNSVGVADVSYHFGVAGDIPVAGDFDGDGCDTLGIYRPAEGRVYVSDTLGSDGGFFVADYAYYFGNPGDKPFTGDFDGDGIDTIGLHRESTGLVYFRNTHSFGVADNQFYFGIPGDRLVAGDWGLIDGVDTPAVFRPAETTFYFRHTNTQGNADTQLTWGQPTWLPVAGIFQPPG
jgi:hypothetical protein